MCIFNKLKVEKIHHFFPLFRLFKKMNSLFDIAAPDSVFIGGAKLNTCRTLKYSCNSPIPTYSSNISPSRSPPVPPPRSMLVKYTLKTTSRNDHFLINLLIHFLIRNWGKFATIFTKNSAFHSQTILVKIVETLYTVIQQTDRMETDWQNGNNKWRCMSSIHK